MILTEFDELLDRLLIGRDETISVCHQPPDGNFRAELTRRAEAPKLAAALADVACVWFSVNPIRDGVRQGRGGVKDVKRCTALYVDLDLKDGGIPNTDTVAKIVEDLRAVIRPETALVETGNGLHVYWALDPTDAAWILDSEEKRIAAQEIYRRFHRLVIQTAGQYGCRVDNVSDLSRVLRVPGTFNRKDPSNPKGVKLWPTLVSTA